MEILIKSGEIILGVLCFIGWLAGMIAWVMRGFSVPRVVHRAALVLFFVGIVSVLIAYRMGIRSMGFMVFALLGFPFWAYVGWFFLGCPMPEPKRDREYDITQALSGKGKR